MTACLTSITLNVVLAAIFAVVTGVVGAAAYARFAAQERARVDTRSLDDEGA